ncbi:hypothetical protein ACIHFD_66720 [Nonomuraea sp. NPDC051941]|uniref:hypothetical protein n=1 Tax=Nonomuraea sp. NPDC051941 TaxID=3364373 RepID=UPI0037C9EB6E
MDDTIRVCFAVEGGAASMVRRLLVMLCMLAAISGCTSWLPETVIKVDPVAINEVRSIGRVVTRTTADPEYKRTVQVIEILVFDVNASDFTEALGVARGRLEQRGWSVVGSADAPIEMESNRWKGTTVRLGKLEDIDPLGARLEPEAEKALQADPAKSGYILVSLSSVGE